MGTLILLTMLIYLIIIIGLPILAIWFLVKIVPRSWKLWKINLRKIDKIIEEDERSRREERQTWQETGNRKCYTSTGYTYNENTGRWEPPKKR